MAVFLTPVFITLLTDSGYTEWAAVLSALLAVTDKYIHVSPDTKARGLVNF